MSNLREQFGMALDAAELGVPTEVIYSELSNQYIRRPVPQGTGAAPEDQTNPFAIQGEPQRQSVGEFAEGIKDVGTGLAAGGAAGIAGLPGDVVGLVEGGVQAARAPEGKKGEAFLTALADVSERIGSAALTEKFEEFVGGLDIDEDRKQALVTSFKIGEFTGLPGLAAAPAVTRAGVATLSDFSQAVKAGRSGQMPGPKADPRGGMVDAEVDPMPNQLPYQELDQLTVIAPGERQQWEQLTADLKIGQPVTTVADAVEAATRNQKVLGRVGTQVAKQIGVKFKNPGVKGGRDAGRRLAQKALERGDVRELTDVTRGGFVVNTAEQADQIVQELAKKFKVVDEGFNVSAEGYFDRKVLIINPDGQVGEVQIWPAPLLEAKESRGHDLYKIIRSKDSTPEQVEAATQESKELYASAQEKLDPSFRSVIEQAAGGADGAQ